MRAVVFKKPFEVAVEHVPDPGVEQSNDAIVRVTSTCICGSDLHMYEGRIVAEPGIVLGRENLGVIEEVGPGVTTLTVGDRVVMPFSMACGFCKNCLAGSTALCLTLNAGCGCGCALPGCARAWLCPGGQAEYLRVPYADFNCLKLPPGTGHESDYALLADVFPTGYHGCELADVRPGESVAVYGAGAVGLLAAYSAMLRGAARVFVVDRVPGRLAAARSIGAEPVDFTVADPAEQIRDATGGEGADKGGEEPAAVLNSLIDAVRPAGMLGIPGPYLPANPAGPSEAARQGKLLLAFGKLFEKGLRAGTGKANVKRYDRRLRDLITAGRAAPSFVVSHNLPLEDAPGAYQKFGQRADGCTKAILHP
jgi:glutathione-independent formaldehyde dehydrogenase